MSFPNVRFNRSMQAYWHDEELPPAASRNISCRVQGSASTTMRICSGVGRVMPLLIDLSFALLAYALSLLLSLRLVLAIRLSGRL
jgi:hypothetical protein